jgi:hypothetical protein
MTKMQHYKNGKVVESEMPNDGTLTPEAQHVFMTGQCHSFALAIASRVVGGVYGQLGEDGKTIEHCFALVFDGNGNEFLVDAVGKYKYRAIGHVRLLPENYKFRGKGWLKPNVEAAAPFAEKRLAEIYAEESDYDEDAA